MRAGKEKDEVSDMIEGRRCARASWIDTSEYVSFRSRVLRLGVRMSEIRRIDGIAREVSGSRWKDKIGSQASVHEGERPRKARETRSITEDALNQPRGW